MLNQSQLARILLPVGELTKAEVRTYAAALGLRTAAKPDSQDVCFITRSGGREAFLGDRIPLHPGRLVDSESGEELGRVPAVELVTVGQRRGMRVGVTATGAERRYALDVDVATGTVTVGALEGLLIDRIVLRQVSWVDQPVRPGTAVEVQMSAHGCPVAGVVGSGAGGAAELELELELAERQRRVAPGQSVVLYHGNAVLGGGVAS
jgi:tRNA-uridine 2-sulfurtransferase